MNAQTPTLQATIRDRKGTRYARRLRAEGRLPAVIYGSGTDPMSITLDHIQTVRHLQSGSHVFEINFDDDTASETCLVKDLQFGWLGDDLIHVDLTRVNLDQEVQVKVRIHFIGEPAHLGTITGATMAYDLTELEVTCKVRDIPEEITVKLEQMTGEQMTIADLDLPSGCTASGEPGDRVCHIDVQDNEGTDAGEGSADGAPEAAAGGGESNEEAGGEGDS
ncbi:MAG: 50S ribosomal protein L25 [Planctomycetota bacterium]|nr:50S ribosomal protein L25 [Planctomycetota bacterium]